MDSVCMICHDPIDLVKWIHPRTNEDYTFCDFCAKSIIGTCHECNDILVSVDRYGVDEKGNKICSRCADGHERADEARAKAAA